jgi:uncharacterized membrane protein
VAPLFPIWSDEQVETIIARLLQTGVLVAGAIVTLGGIVFLIRHGLSIPHYSVFTGEPSGLRSVSGILAGTLTLQGRNLIQFGLFILLATPVARVAFAVVAFAFERDRLYVGVSLTVLVVLVYSLAWGG